MTGAWNRPRQRLDRARLGMTFFGAVMCLLPLSQLLTHPISTGSAILALVAGPLIVALVVLAHVREGRIPVLLVPAAPALLVVMGVGLSDRISIVGACLGLAASLTMYGSRRSILLRTGCLLLVPLLCVELSENPAAVGETVSIRNAASGLVVVVLFTGLIYLLRNTLESQSMTIAREGFMSRVAGGLLASNTIQDVTRVMVRANDEFDDVSPGMITLELHRVRPGEPGPAGGARLLAAHGTGGLDLPEYLPAAALTGLPPLDVDGEIPLPAGTSALAQLGLPTRNWHAVTLERLPDAPCDLILHGVRSSIGQKLFGVLTPEETEFLDVRRRIRAHWHATMARMQARDDLIEAAERDEITGLPDRTATMRRIVELVHTSKDRVGLVLMEISGLDLVEGQNGLSAADMAMGQLAHRVTAVVEGRGRVGRSGDASFAVALTNADSHDEVELLVERLEDVLMEPVLLPSGPVRLGAGFGVARTTTSGTAADLIERAVSSLAVHTAGGRHEPEDVRMSPS